MPTSTPRRITTAALAAALTMAFAPAVASADPCSLSLTNDAGEWELNSNGSISDVQNDAYDTSGDLSIIFSGTETNFNVADSNACTYEDEGREVVYPQNTIEGLNVSRKVFVPSTGTFARWLELLSNPTDAPITVTVRRSTNWGSDSGTIITATSDGDTVAEVGDTWWTNDEDDFEDSKVASMIDSASPAKRDAFDALPTVPGAGDDDAEIDYENVTIQPGQTFVFMFVDDISESRAGAIAAAQALQGGTDAMYAGISADERALLRNWPTAPDPDSDGVTGASDNCPTAANADQANLGGDAEGDACDADDDNDGVTDVAEAQTGTNPRLADSDGDGKNDGVDVCPRKSGSAADGCPPAAVVQPPAILAPRLTPRQVTANARAARLGGTGGPRVVVTTTGRVRLPDGTTPGEACNDGRVSVQVKASSKTVSTRRVALRKDCTYRSSVTFRQLERLVGDVRVRAVFNGNTRLSRRASPRTPVNIPGSKR